MLGDVSRNGMMVESKDLLRFESILNQLYDLAQRSGISELEKRGYKQSDFESNPSIRREFLRACHYGYDVAQRKIAKLVIDMELEIARLTAEMKDYRRKKDGKEKEVFQLIRMIRNRQKVLRRIVDSILFTMIQQQNWLLRRFTIDLKIHAIDPEVLNRTVQIAVDRNREDRMKFNLVSDLSTVVQIGDLIEIDASVRGGGKWKVIELKQGKMNELISGILGLKSSSADAVVAVKTSLGEKAEKQAHRMIRQVRRVGELERIVETDRGFDPSNDVETLMTKDTLVLDNYHDEMMKLYESANVKGAAALEVSGCLRIFAIPQDKAGQRTGEVAAHQFFHAANKDLSCAFRGAGDPASQAEEKKMLKSVPYFVDIVDYNLNVPMADPIFAWPNRRMVIDLVVGRMRMFVQFDIDAFIRLAEGEGVKLRWIKGKEADKLKKFSMRIPGSDDAWGILAEFPDGTHATFLAGFLARPYMNCTTPRQMIEMIKDWPKQFAKSDPENALISPI